MSLTSRYIPSLKLPIIVAPMFLVSGVEMLLAACREGVVGTITALNARSSEDLDGWLSETNRRLAEEGITTPYGVNLILHKTNPRLSDDIDLVVKHKAPIIIASVGNPKPVIERVHAYGGLVYADVASVAQAKKAAASGVDGLILLCGGAGGQTGWLNPFAFTAEVRQFFDKTVVVAGGINSGSGVRAAEVMGADMAYMGTHFIAATESLAPAEYRELLAESGADDVLTTKAVSGIPANFIRQSLEKAGVSLDTDAKLDMNKFHESELSWKGIWSAGHGVGNVAGSQNMAEIVAGLDEEYRQALNIGR